MNEIFLLNLIKIKVKSVLKLIKTTMSSLFYIEYFLDNIFLDTGMIKSKIIRKNFIQKFS